MAGNVIRMLLYFSCVGLETEKLRRKKERSKEIERVGVQIVRCREIGLYEQTNCERINVMKEKD